MNKELCKNNLLRCKNNLLILNVFLFFFIIFLFIFFFVFFLLSLLSNLRQPNIVLYLLIDPLLFDF